MLRKIYWTFFVFPLTVLLVALAVANRHSVQLVLDPFQPKDPAYAIDLPFYVYLAAAVLTGLLLGGFTTWVGQGKWRRTARQQRHETSEWRGEAARLNRQIEASKLQQLPQGGGAD